MTTKQQWRRTPLLSGQSFIEVETHVPASASRRRAPPKTPGLTQTKKTGPANYYAAPPSAEPMRISVAMVHDRVSPDKRAGHIGFYRGGRLFQAPLG